MSYMGGGFAGGLYQVIGPRLKQHLQDEHDAKLKQLDFYHNLLTTGNLSAEEAQTIHDNITALVSGSKGAKGLLKGAAPHLDPANVAAINEHAHKAASAPIMGEGASASPFQMAPPPGMAGEAITTPPPEAASAGPVIPPPPNLSGTPPARLANPAGLPPPPARTPAEPIQPEPTAAAPPTIGEIVAHSQQAKQEQAKSAEAFKTDEQIRLHKANMEGDLASKAATTKAEREQIDTDLGTIEQKTGIKFSAVQRANAHLNKTVQNDLVSKGLKSENILVDGIPTVAAFDSEKGAYLDSTTGKPITGKIAPYEKPTADKVPTTLDSAWLAAVRAATGKDPTSAEIEAHQKQLTENRIPAMTLGTSPIYNPETGEFGLPIFNRRAGTLNVTSLVSGPTAQEKTTAGQALKIADQVKEIRTELTDPEVTALVGPLVGRAGNRFLTDYDFSKELGYATPLQVRKFNKLRTDLRSLAAMQAIIHGYRGGEGVYKTFSDSIGGPQRSVAALLGSLDAVDSLAAKVYLEGTRGALATEAARQQEDKGPKVPAPPGQSKPQRKVGDSVIYQGKPHTITAISPTTGKLTLSP